MRADRYTLTACGTNGVIAVEAPLAELAATEVRVAVDYSMVSPGTERHYLQQVRETGEQLPLGYCAVGVVRAVGAQVAGLQPGDRVVAMGWKIATHSNWIQVPQRLVCKVPPSLTQDQAILATLGATAVHAVDRAQLLAGEQILVVGMGLVGKMLGLVAACHGAQIWVADLNPAAIDPGLPVQVLDLLAEPGAMAGRFTRIFLCIDGDISALFARLLALLAPEGNGQTRSRLVNVGRVSLTLELSPQMGNIDIVNVSRCGNGYRDDAYHHGLKDVQCPVGEASVERNIARCLDYLVAGKAWLEHLQRVEMDLEQALQIYNSAAFFAPGINLIKHREG
ncbi:zinc-dependent alcohol dehydrogenase [Pseudomonas sp. 910_21]|uniref:zinc-dependent alcohol dehydrogenase n=1 Tax=Pseudomonas sp. 910_21 TaxID=2604460 RepID=UPI0040647FCF